jgi:transposase
MASDQNFKRRQYSAQLKSQVVGECDVPGASVARVAMAHGINANVAAHDDTNANALCARGAALGCEATAAQRPTFIRSPCPCSCHCLGDANPAPHRSRTASRHHHAQTEVARH